MSNIDMNELELGETAVKKVSGGHVELHYAEVYKCLVCGQEAGFLTDPNEYSSRGSDVVMHCGQRMVYTGIRMVHGG